MTRADVSFPCCACEYELCAAQLNTPCPECGYTNTTYLKLGSSIRVLARGALLAAIGFPCLVVSVLLIHFQDVLYSRSGYSFGWMMVAMLFPIAAGGVWARGIYVLASYTRELVEIQWEEGLEKRSWFTNALQGSRGFVGWMKRYGQFGWLGFFTLWHVVMFTVPAVFFPVGVGTPAAWLRWYKIQIVVSDYTIPAFVFLLACLILSMQSVVLLCKEIKDDGLRQRFVRGRVVVPIGVTIYALSEHLWKFHTSTVDEMNGIIFLLFCAYAALTGVAVVYVTGLWVRLYGSLKRLGQEGLRPAQGMGEG